MWPSLEITPKTITVAVRRVVRCVELCPQALNRPYLHFEGACNGSVVITWIGREHDLYSGHLRSRSLNIVSLSDMIEGSYRSWDLYTTGQLVDGLQQKKKKKKKKRKRKLVFIKRKWNHVVFSRATILSFHHVQLLKTIAHLNWGGSKKKKKKRKKKKRRKNIIKIIKIISLINQIKIDYGCFIYGTARKTYLKELNTIYDQGLRLSLGAYSTSPVENLYIEKDEPPLTLRREKLALKYSTKLKILLIQPSL